MCGLTGFFDPTAQDDAELHQQLRRMTANLVHRGPDAEGYWLEDGVALGFRRLSILDLSEAGAQPMLTACQRYVMVFNGEIYNHLEMRNDLDLAGQAPAWRGHSDTETLLAGIAHWGLEETLRRACGMFAIVLWDRKRRCLSLARDRMGEKPLYWGWAGRALVFGSELKALRVHPGFDSQVCRTAVAQFLRFAYVPAPRSIYTNIYKLEPGCFLEVTGAPPETPPSRVLRPGMKHGNLSIRRYWSLSDTIEAGACDPITDEAEAIDAAEMSLSRAVRRQLLSDVPLGAFLSGGVDSSTIVALMQAQSDRPVQTFTVGFEDSGFDESPHAAAVARHLGTDHTELRVTAQEARDVIPHLPDLYDEPFADSSQVPTHLVCRAARQRVTVALSGDGGDELFGGYNRYFWGPRIWNRLSPLPVPARRLLGSAISAVPAAGWDRLGALSSWVLPATGGVARLGDKAHRLAARLRDVQSMDDLYVSLVSEWPDGASMVRGAENELPAGLTDTLPQCVARDPVARMMLRDMWTYLPDDILCKVDRAAMGVSLETRVPFLDPDVVALAARIPMALKLRDNAGKWILRQVLYRHVPAALVERPKMGFGIPVGAWLRGPLRPWAEELLSVDRLERDGLVSPEPVRRIWQEHLSGSRDWTQRLWIVLMLQAWLESLA